MLIPEFIYITNPLVPFLTPDQIKSGIPLVIGSAAVLPVVLVVSDFMGVDPIGMQDRRHGVIKRFQGPPGPMQKVVTPGVHFPSSRHTRHGSDIEVIKLDGPFRQPLEVRRLDPIVAVAREKMPA